MELFILFIHLSLWEPLDQLTDEQSLPVPFQSTSLTGALTEIRRETSASVQMMTLVFLVALFILDLGEMMNQF